MRKAFVVLGVLWTSVLVASTVPQLDPYAAPDGARLLSAEISTTWDTAFTLAEDASTRDVVCRPGTHGMACWLPCMVAIQWLANDRPVGPRLERQQPSPACELLPLQERSGCRTVIEHWPLPGATDADRTRWIEGLCPQFDPSWVDT